MKIMVFFLNKILKILFIVNETIILKVKFGLNLKFKPET